MCPPKPTVPRAGNIFDRVRFCMMIAMICDPRARRTRTVENSEQDEQLLDDWIQPKCPMCKRSVVCDGRSECAHAGKN
jgi:hypothetical protein